jgi:DNA-directed RNA polymerase subunit beta'
LGIGDIVPFTIIASLSSAITMYGYINCSYKPIILGITKSTLACSGLLATISFQETTKMLNNAAIKSSTDWLTDLKSKIIATDLLPTGTGWYRYFQKIKPN